MKWRAIVVGTVRFIVLFVPVVLFGGTILFIRETKARLSGPQRWLVGLWLVPLAAPLWSLAVLRYGRAIVLWTYGDVHTSYLEWLWNRRASRHGQILF